MKPISFWRDTQELPNFPALGRDVEVDVAVIGGGITGITAAYLFKKAGAKVALLERDKCGGVDTAHTTAHLTCVTDERLSTLAKTFGKDHARAAWEAGYAAIDRIAMNIQTENIACDFEWLPGYLVAPAEEKNPDHDSLKQDAALARELGFGAEFLENVPGLRRPGVRFDNQAKFHPLKYLAGLLPKIPGDGSHVFESSAVEEFGEKEMTVSACGHRVRCRHIVLATHTPLMGRAGMLSATMFQSKLYYFNSYVLGARIPHGSFPHALFWDTAEPYKYLRVENGEPDDYVIFGGQDHKTGQETNTEESYARLEKDLRLWLPQAEIEHRWSGQVIETNDGLPFIGETAEGQFAATGFAGNGMTFGTLAAMMAVDAFFKRSNPWTDLFAPDRKKVRGGTWSYVAENKDYPYYMLRDRLARAEAKELAAVKPGEGKIVSVNGKKVAVHRSEIGELTLCSPVCTHLKCIVKWNAAEHTWDCPCHGSRFKPTGEVMSGPAEENLEQLHFEQKELVGQKH